jgi:hypothetical protein
MNQRQPSVEEPAYLAWVRLQPCLVCGRRGPSDAAHIRAAAPQYGKRYTGKGEKPDDCWTLPLCRQHHEDQHRTNELGWWAGKGIDPFATAMALYASRPEALKRPRQERRRIVKVKPRRPKSARRSVGPSRPVQSDPRPIQSRPFPKLPA